MNAHRHIVEGADQRADEAAHIATVWLLILVPLFFLWAMLKESSNRKSSTKESHVHND